MNITIKFFFISLDLPEALKVMDEDINLKEISSASSSFLNSKAPGPHGFRTECFKSCEATVASH